MYCSSGKELAEPGHHAHGVPPYLCEPRGPECGDLPAAGGDCARPRLDQTEDAHEECRLARPAGAGHLGRLAGGRRTGSRCRGGRTPRPGSTGRSPGARTHRFVPSSFFRSPRSVVSPVNRLSRCVMAPVPQPCAAVPAAATITGVALREPEDHEEVTQRRPGTPVRFRDPPARRGRGDPEGRRPRCRRDQLTAGSCRAKRRTASVKAFGASKFARCLARGINSTRAWRCARAKSASSARKTVSFSPLRISTGASAKRIEPASKRPSTSSQAAGRIWKA